MYIKPNSNDFMTLYLRFHFTDPCTLGGRGRGYFEDRVRVRIPGLTSTF